MACRPTSLECRLVAAVEGRELAVGVGWVAGGLVEVNDVVKIFGGAKLGGDRSWKDMVLQVALVVLLGLTSLALVILFGELFRTIVFDEIREGFRPGHSLKALLVDCQLERFDR